MASTNAKKGNVQPVAPPNSAYPPTTPTWMITILDTLDEHSELTGISPVAIAAIAQAESGFEKAGAGINSEGFGGYFGIHETETYGGYGSISAATLESNTQAAFERQAKLAAHVLATLTDANNGRLITAVNEYVTGSPNPDATLTIDAKLVEQYVLGGKKTAATGTARAGAPSGGATAGGVIPTSLTIGGDIESLGAEFSGIAGFITKLENLTFWRRVGIFIGGAALAGLGVFLLAQGSKTVRQAETTAATTAALA